MKRFIDELPMALAALLPAALMFLALYMSDRVIGGSP